MPGLFQYRLRPLAELIATWEAMHFEVRQYLAGWFWLTDGDYWFNTTDGSVPTTHPAFAALYPRPDAFEDHIGYQVARLWMDLQDTRAAALEPLPEPFAGWVTSGAWDRWEQAVLAWWRELDDQDDRASDRTADAVSEVRGWWGVRHLDMGYLSVPPTFRWWRVGDTVTFEWDTRGQFLDGVPSWMETHGRQHFSAEAFEGEVAAFRAQLDAAMQVRLREVAALNLLDDRQLASLKRQHEESLSQAGRWEGTDWKAVRAFVTYLERLSGIRMQ